MSELGQKEGQEQGENAPFFDSSKISDKKEIEHFANVEGAEERAKKAEQAKKAAEKEAQEVHAADVRAASDQMKKREAKTTGKKRGIIGFLFGGWHKIVTIVVLLAFIGGGIFLVLGTVDESYSVKKEHEQSAFEAALVVDDDARIAFEINPNEETYGQAKKIYEDSIAKADKYEVAFLKMKYAEFVYENTYDFDAAVSILDGVTEEIKTEVGADYYNYYIKRMYEKAGAADEFKEIIVESE